jgi:hypothetical protein
MAINFLNKVNFNQNELDKARIVNEVNDTAAGTPVDGQLYYDTTLNVIKVGEGGLWVSISGDITEVQSATATAQRGIKVTSPAGPIPVVGLDIIGQTNLASAPATDDELIIYDTSAATNKAVTIANLASAVQGNNGYATTITAWGGTITHSLGSFDVTVQLYDDTSKETIYAEIDRTGVNTIVVNGNGTFPSTNVRVLVSKVS